ncbi:hypothetical protein C8J56DRAFT_888868 [Mycena floridula]|nr:hypothetical protein C8J56DRAFT_888868 [Mycena floridula]
MSETPETNKHGKRGPGMSRPGTSSFSLGTPVPSTSAINYSPIPHYDATIQPPVTPLPWMAQSHTFHAQSGLEAAPTGPSQFNQDRGNPSAASFPGSFNMVQQSPSNDINTSFFAMAESLENDLIEGLEYVMNSDLLGPIRTYWDMAGAMNM